MTRVAALLLACLAPGAASAAGAWLPADDARLRADISLLIDEGIANLPATTWPLPTRDVARVLDRIDVATLYEPALQGALLRTRARVASGNDGEWEIREITVTAGEPGSLRDAGTVGRDNAAIRSSGGAQAGRLSVTLDATFAAGTEDGRNLRLDGSEATLRWGNWLFSANQMDRWWGPGWYGSLILSTNARPMPQLSLDRLESTRSSLPILRWFGPWRFSAFFAAMEQQRADVDHPLFMGMRLSFKPAPILEVALSRSAQFCGRGRACGLGTFRDVLLGNDNAGLRVSPEDEPGNQMAGIDLRIVSPVRSLPFALYAQMIGEDNSSTGIPERYLGLFGAETWTMLEEGGLVRLRLEYANTNCKFSAPRDQANCAYRQAIFSAGYRYHGRNVGHTADADAESWALGASYVFSDGDQIGLHLRRSILDVYGFPDPYNPLTRGPAEHRSAEMRWDGRLFGERFEAQLGYEHADGGALRSGGLYGALQWRMTL